MALLRHIRSAFQILSPISTGDTLMSLLNGTIKPLSAVNSACKKSAFQPHSRPQRRKCRRKTRMKAWQLYRPLRRKLFAAPDDRPLKPGDRQAHAKMAEKPNQEKNYLISDDNQIRRDCQPEKNVIHIYPAPKTSISRATTTRRCVLQSLPEWSWRVSGLQLTRVFYGQGRHDLE